VLTFPSCNSYCGQTSGTHLAQCSHIAYRVMKVVADDK